MYDVKSASADITVTSPYTGSYNKIDIAYDTGGASRLARETFKVNGGASAWDVQYGYDAGGNRTSLNNGTKAFTVAGNCGNCHKGMKPREIEFKTNGITDASFSHKFHLGMYSCAECHPRLYLPGKGNVTVSMAGMETQKSCGACHDGKSAFTVKENCEKCHQMGKN